MSVCHLIVEPGQPQNITLPYRTNDTLWITWDQLGVVESFTWSVNDTDMTRGDILPPPLYNASCYQDCHSWKMNLSITNLTTAGEMYSVEINATVSNVASDPLTVSHATGNGYYFLCYLF